MNTIAASDFPMNLSDFDFTIDKSRQRLSFNAVYDGFVTIRLPGTDRRTANHELILTPFLRKNKLKFKMIAVGSHKKNKECIIVFDNPNLIEYSTEMREYSNTGISGIVNSKSYVEKLIQFLSPPLPNKQNQVKKIFFKLTPIIETGKPNYNICAIALVKSLGTDAGCIDYKKVKNRTKQTRSGKRFKKAIIQPNKNIL